MMFTVEELDEPMRTNVRRYFAAMDAFVAQHPTEIGAVWTWQDIICARLVLLRPLTATLVEEIWKAFPRAFNGYCVSGGEIAAYEKAHGLPPGTSSQDPKSHWSARFAYTFNQLGKPFLEIRLDGPDDIDDEETKAERARQRRKERRAQRRAASGHQT
jgi:hypothetical protein